MIDVIGTDAGAPASLPAALQALVRAAEQIAAPRRLQPALQTWLNRTVPLIDSDDPRHLAQVLNDLSEPINVVVLASGDPLWFGIGRLLLQHFSAEQLRFHPCPCSMQLAFARLGKPWQNAQWLSLHGREPDALSARLQQRPEALAVLTDPSRGGAAEVRTILSASGLETAYEFWLCERLDHPQERVLQLEPSDELPADLDPLHLVVLIARTEPLVAERLPLFGIADGL